MAPSHVLSGLHDKRARLAGEIEAAQRALAKQRDTLATLDAVIRLFEPAGNPDLIPAIRPAGRRCLFFRHGEQSRLVLSALRDAKAPTTVRQVTDYALAAKGLDVEPRIRAQITESIRITLYGLTAKGIVRKLVTWPDTWWELAID